MTDAQRIYALRSLIKVLTGALKIVKMTHYTDPRLEIFTPEKTKVVVESALICAAEGEFL